ncbi:unnamed protein product [Sphagnum jensenii]|uniref:Uncharacterized protein n=1 Tax=Sphagnum jensenii TaxID=128206 RepID=A0ABP1ARQ4_9BRYO
MTSLWWENGCSLEDGGKHGTSLQGELVLPKEWNEVSGRSDIYPAGRVGVHHGMEGSPRGACGKKKIKGRGGAGADLVTSPVSITSDNFHWSSKACSHPQWARSSQGTFDMLENA